MGACCCQVSTGAWMEVSVGSSGSAARIAAWEAGPGTMAEEVEGLARTAFGRKGPGIYATEGSLKMFST